MRSADGGCPHPIPGPRDVSSHSSPGVGPGSAGSEQGRAERGSPGGGMRCGGVLLSSDPVFATRMSLRRVPSSDISMRKPW